MLLVIWLLGYCGNQVKKLQICKVLRLLVNSVHMTLIDYLVMVVIAVMLDGLTEGHIF